MVSQGTTRREIIKSSGAIASVGILGALSGCSGGDGGGNGNGNGNGSSPIAYSQGPDAVPSGSTAMMDMNLQEFFDDDGLRRILEASAQSGTGAGMGLEAQMDQVQNDMGVDPRQVSGMIGFGDSAESMGGGTDVDLESDAYGGTIVWSELSREAVVSLIEDNVTGSVTESDYEGTTLYTAGETGQVTAYVGDGTVVAGSEAAVTDVIDLVGGSGEAISGEVRSVYESTQDGPAQFALQFPDIEGEGMSSGGQGGGMQVTGGLLTDVTWVSGSMLYDAGGGDKGLALHFRFANSETANQTTQFATQFMQQYQSQLESSPDESGQQLAETLSKMSVSQDGQTVTLSYEDSVENYVNSIQSGADTAMGGGMMGGG
jgi:hypothetical protein